MQGWIFYKRSMSELTEMDHGVNRLLSAASELQIELNVYRPSQLSVMVSDSNPALFLDNTSVKLPDFIIPRLGAETTYHALALIRHLELKGVRSINNSSSIGIAKDKLRVAQLLMVNKLPTPKTLLLNIPESIPLVAQEIGFPAVIKDTASAKGVGVFLCETANSFEDLLGLLGEPPNKQLIAQEFIANSYGRDLRVLVLGSKIIGCMQRTAKDSFKANYSLGAEVSTFPLSKEIKNLALACTKLVGLDIAGIDLLFGANGLVICEANSSPGFKGMELATGEDIAIKILKYVIKQCTTP